LSIGNCRGEQQASYEEEGKDYAAVFHFSPFELVGLLEL
jgi:hypothetical protein